MNKNEKKHYEKLFKIGCIVCRNLGFGYSAPHIHHIRHGVGLSQRSHWSLSIPLCPNHHQHGGYGIALHSGQKTFEKKYGTESELLQQTLTILEGEL
ncbi:hypothetical protein P19250A_0052 [Methylophilaceae phage P19250A]|nr:hypothetical protein P19250A_0052 [Methylophilaceae phage P19250A]